MDRTTGRSAHTRSGQVSPSGEFAAHHLPEGLARWSSGCYSIRIWRVHVLEEYTCWEITCVRRVHVLGEFMCWEITCVRRVHMLKEYTC